MNNKDTIKLIDMLLLENPKMSADYYLGVLKGIKMRLELNDELFIQFESEFLFLFAFILILSIPSY